MRFKCGLTKADREKLTYQKKLDWHRYFAWWPVRVGPNDCRWLEYVERKGTPTKHDCAIFWDYEYRPYIPYAGF